MLVGLTALDRLRTLRFHAGNTIQRANCLTLCALALALTITLPGIYRGLDHYTSQTNLAKLCADILSIYGFWAFQPIVSQLIEAHLIAGRRAQSMQARRKLLGSRWLVLGVVATLGVLFWLAPVHDTEASSFTGFVERFGAAPFIAEYTLVVMIYLAAQTYDLFLLAKEAARVLPTVELRLRARLQALGWTAILALYGHECLYVILRRAGDRYPFPDSSVIRNLLLASGVALLMSGGFLDMHQWWKHYRDYRALFSLWRRVALEPSGPALLDALKVTRIELRRYDRVMEIWDGMVALQPYTEQAIVASARAHCRNQGLAQGEAQIIVEAVGLLSALSARQGSRPAKQPIAAPLRSQGLTEDLDDAVAYLLQLAWALEHSPLVPSIVNLVEDSAAARNDSPMR